MGPNSRAALRALDTVKKRTRILIADREGVFRLGLTKLLGVEDDLRVVAQAETAAQLLPLAKSFHPDLIFLQNEILAEGGGNFLAEVRRTAPQGKAVITASAMSEDEALRHVQAGAAGVVLKSMAPSLFVKCIRSVLSNEVWLPKHPSAPMSKGIEGMPQQTRRPVETLTRREKTIISCLMQGWHNREIASHLAITEQTVKNHLRAIYDKVGVSDRLELVLYAIHQKLELPPMELAEAAS
jgi:DNA-binding NarL/FixJ family response regulator